MTDDANFAAAPDRARLITIDEAAARLAISKPMIFKMLRNGKLKRVKLGSATRIRLSDIDRLTVETV